MYETYSVTWLFTLNNEKHDIEISLSSNFKLTMLGLANAGITTHPFKLYTMLMTLEVGLSDNVTSHYLWNRMKVKPWSILRGVSENSVTNLAPFVFNESGITKN